MAVDNLFQDDYENKSHETYDQHIERLKTEIDRLSQLDMARLVRFSEAGHKFFDRRNVGVYEYFVKKFREKGGMTPEISKTLGWDK